MFCMWELARTLGWVYLKAACYAAYSSTEN